MPRFIRLDRPPDEFFFNRLSGNGDQPIGIHTTYGMWYPHPSEVMDCCKELSVNESKNKWGYYIHCKTAKHVANLLKTDIESLKVKRAKAMFLLQELGVLHSATITTTAERRAANRRSTKPLCILPKYIMPKRNRLKEGLIISPSFISRKIGLRETYGSVI